MYRALLLLACFLLCASAQAHTRLYRSPDGSCTGSVTALPGTLDGNGEGIVKVYQRHKLRIQRGFVSGDHEHGQYVERAAWTPDSLFFVFATLSSGGHSAWHHWTFVWSRRDGKTHSLDDAFYQLGQNAGTMTDRFRLTAPDRITTRLWNNTDNGVPLSVRLSRVHWKPGIGDSR